MFILSVLQTAVILSMPLFIPDRQAQSALDDAETPEIFNAEGISEAADEDENYTIELLNDGKTLVMPMRDYLFGVVAAEMPAAFEAEALKAQTVAARTYAIYRIGSDVHGGCICSDAACCQAWLSTDELKEKWCVEYGARSSKILSAVRETDGLCISYGGEAILAAFHSSSGGRTENSENVFQSVLPYLRSVESPETAEKVPNLVSEVSLTADELYSAVSAWDASAALPASGSAVITDAVRSDSGRVIRATLCGKEVSGSELRRIFGLRSALVYWEYGEDGGITFSCTGYGHGVGMSQYGANEMAAQGSDFRAILAHYYPGTALTAISDLEFSGISS